MRPFWLAPLACIPMVAPAAAQSLLTQGRAQALPNIVYPSGSSVHRDEASAQRDRGGHYYFDATVNGAPLHMIFDTGASLVFIRAEDAPSLGIDTGALRYTVISNTANGKTDVAPVTLSRMTVGGITRQNVRAMVAKPGTLSINLLGQSFLALLSGYQLEGDRLILRGGS